MEHRPKPLRQKLSSVAIRPPRVAQQRRKPSDEAAAAGDEDGIYDSLHKPVYERDSWAHGVDELLRRSVHYHVKVV